MVEPAPQKRLLQEKYTKDSNMKPAEARAKLFGFKVFIPIKMWVISI